jgi:hypothetical protein
MITIAGVLHQPALTVEEDVLGIITLVYYGDLPNAVREFLGRFQNIGHMDIFLLLNYGWGAGVSLSTARKIFH